MQVCRRIATSSSVLIFLIIVFWIDRIPGDASNGEYEYPPYDGWFNNLVHPDWGAADTQLFRHTKADYGDGVFKPSGHNRPNPISISQVMMNGSTGHGSYKNRTGFLLFFAQQVVEEVLDAQRAGCPPEYFNIPIPKGHPEFDPEGRGGYEMPILRSRYDQTTGHCPGVPRQQLNEITPYIDGTLVYGPHKAWSDGLRKFEDGLLAALNDTNSTLRYVPAMNTIRLPYANPPPPRDDVLKPVSRFWRIGNPRGNENPFLLSFGILWFRLHNFRARQLKANHADWNDEKLFNEARKYTIAVYQKLVLYDWLPAWLGNNFTTPPYVKYDPTIHPGIDHAFQSAAMRFGHTLVPPGVFRRNASCYFYQTTAATKFAGHKALRTCNTYWNGQEAVTESDVDEIYMGLASQIAEREDTIITPDLRGNVFGFLDFTRRDLMAVNIQRARDHGLTDYNKIREQYGLKRRTRFEDVNPFFTANYPQLVEDFRNLYNNSLDDIDLWPGGLFETTPEGPGELFRTILADQFLRIRNGDRFWFENTLNGLHTPDEIAEIHNITIYQILLNVTKIKPGDIQVDPFFFVTDRGDPCPQPFQLNHSAGQMEDCTPLSRFDYWTGSNVPYVLSFFLLFLAFFVVLGIMLCVVRRQKSRLRMQGVHRRRAGDKFSQLTDAFTAVEWVGKHDVSRTVIVRFNSQHRSINVEGVTSQPLRTIDLSPVRDRSDLKVGIILSADRSMTILLIRPPNDYDLVLDFENIALRQKFLDEFQSFLDSIHVLKEEIRLVSASQVKSMAITKNHREKMLTKFMRHVISKAFGYQNDPDEIEQVHQEDISYMEITKSEFAEILGMKSRAVFVENMFRMVDKSNTGYVSLREFLDVFVIFAKGSWDQKIKLMFDMYDVDRKGLLTSAEFKSMLRSLVDLGSETVADSKIESLIGNMCERVGIVNKAALSFEEFKRVLTEYQGDLTGVTLGINEPVDKNVLREAGITRARKTIVRALSRDDTVNEKGRMERMASRLDRVNIHEKKAYPHGKARQTWLGIIRYLENHRLHIFWITLYTLVVIGIFVERAYYYSVEREQGGLRRIAGYGVSITRGAASAQMFTYSTLLVTMSRNFITFCRGTFLNQYIPFDAAFSFHKFVAYMAVSFSFAHVIGHSFNFYHISTQPPNDLGCLFNNFFHPTDALPKLDRWLWQTITGVSGVILVLVLYVIFVFASSYSRRHSFRAFYFTHKLYIALFCLMIIHGIGRLIQPPIFYYYFLGPVVLFTLDKMVTISQRKTVIPVIKAEMLPSDVLHLEFKRPQNFDYKSGQWVRIACEAVGSKEFHPFTLTSSPNEETLSVHIRAVGPWTYGIRRLYDPDMIKEHALPKIYLNGPYGEGHEDWGKYEVSVLVGGGIGVTPYASILKDLTVKSQAKSSLLTKKVYFLWVCRSQRQFEWLTDIIREAEEKDNSNLLSAHIFITQYKEKFDIRTTMLYICERHFQKISGRSLLTGLSSITHFGRPDFESFFVRLREEHPQTTVFGVFTCGPLPLTNSVDKACSFVNRTCSDVLFVPHAEAF